MWTYSKAAGFFLWKGRPCSESCSFGGVGGQGGHGSGGVVVADEEKVALLEGMGFAADMARSELLRHRNNADAAANALMELLYGA